MMTENTNGMNFGPMDLLMLFCTLVWGVNYWFIKVALVGWTPMMMNTFRLFLAALSLIIFLKASGRLKKIERQHRRRLAIGTLIFSVYQLAYLFGVKGTLTWKAAILNGTMPIFVAIIAFIIKDEIPSVAVWLAVLLSFLGIVFLMSGNIELSDLISGEYFLGDLLSLTAAVCWALYTIAMKPLTKHYSPLLISTFPIVFSMIIFIPFTIAELPEQKWGDVTFIALVAATASGLLSIALGNVVWYQAVRLAGNIRTSVYSNLIPVWSIMLALLFLGEKMTILELAGAGMVLLGVGLSKFKIAMPTFGRRNIN